MGAQRRGAPAPARWAYPPFAVGLPSLELYRPTYHGAYVLDPDGNNVEVVCHRPE